MPVFGQVMAVRGWSRTRRLRAAIASRTGGAPQPRGHEASVQAFSFPGAFEVTVRPDVPGSIHEGGELGYSLAHAFGAALENPDLSLRVVGDGEAETGPLATAWHSNKFLNPQTDGVVLPILHLNGYKIANPPILARIPRTELESLLVGYSWIPILSRATSLGRCTRRWQKPLTVCSRRSLQSKSAAEEAVRSRAPGGR